MNRNEFIRRFPNASASTIAANCPDAGLSGAESERHQAPALEPAIPRETQSVGRTRVCFTGYRLRLLDPDNFAGSVKDLLDGLRHAGLLDDDTSDKIILQTEQVRVNHKSEEKTVIEILYP